MKAFGKIDFDFILDDARRGAKYSLDGVHFMNNGEFCEIVAKYSIGAELRKDASTPFDVDSDIPEYHASVKSSAATVANMVLGNNLNESLNEYFRRCASSFHWYVTVNNREYTIYKMTAAVFEKFLRRFSKINERGYIRINKESDKMIKWLNANV